MRGGWISLTVRSDMGFSLPFLERSTYSSWPSHFIALSPLLVSLHISGVLGL